ncbi:response regulator transcription factor [Amaricoccus sp. B4]|uniref:response regulator transcription factor n=1 Tax=Amaricoccus sp. B4 TaxID=3368557 RepID=UPI0037126B59
MERKDPQVFVDRRPRLTARERDVLCLLANGHLNARIAERLGISEPTVRAHMISARRKLGCATREQAVAVAITLGLISP